MNLQALLDGLLAIVAFYIALQAPRTAPALRLAASLLGAAATLGALRFSGLLPLPPLHQYMSMLGAGVALPLLAIAVTQNNSVVASQRRFAWIFAVIAAVVCTLVVMVAQQKWWAPMCAVAAALSIVVYGARHRKLSMAATGVLLLATLIGFATRVQVGPLQPGDLLHIGMALTLLAIHRLRQPTVQQAA